MNLETILYIVPGALLSLTFHEFSHAAVAYWRGDDTAKMMGRLTLNPLKHLDPLGTVMMFIMKFGWAKPVPVNPMNLANPKKDMVLVSFAGPASNMILAFLTSIVLRLLNITNIQIDSVNVILFFMLYINLALAIFNLIPIAPLDGSKILAGFLPYDKLVKYDQLMQRGPLILLGLIIFSRITGISILGMIIVPWNMLWFRILLGNSVLQSIFISLNNLNLPM